jgi:YihY family inner membrane protein
MNWMIYGANGYTGGLIAREAKYRGLKPILAGRSADKVAALATELDCECRVFGIGNPDEMARQLQGVALVLHCAGPFSATSAPMITACLKARAHYLDITGEISVFEHAQTRNAEAQQAGVVVCPGVGFDVIPTDCVAAALKQALPDATHLALGFDTRSAASPGTAKTFVEGLALGGKVRRDGKIVQVPLAAGVRKIDFGDGEKLAMTMPVGDVSTAYHTTGIPNIEVYIPVARRMIANARRANYLRWLLGSGPVQSFLKKKAGQLKGPNVERRSSQPTYVWGEATNARGQKKTARIKTENGYSLTVTGSLAVTAFLTRNKPAGGSYTPAKLMGADLVTRLPGSGPMTIESRSGRSEELMTKKRTSGTTAAIAKDPGPFVIRVAKGFRANQGFLLAGAVAYHTLLSLVPLTILVLIGLSHFVEEAELLRTMDRYLELVVPGQSEAIMAELTTFLDHRDVIGWVLIVTIIFFSSLAFTVLENAMSVIFHHRAAIKRRHFLISALIPYCFILSLGIGLLVVTVVSGFLQTMGAEDINLFGKTFSLGGLSGFLFYAIGVIGEVLVLSAIYLVMPVGRLSWRHALIGGVTAAVLWEITRHTLVVYFSTLSQVSVVYGSLTTSIVVLLSLEIAAMVLLIGAQVIAEYERYRSERANAALKR